MLSVILPTIAGREESLARAIASYEDTLAGVPHEICIMQDYPSWPAACNAGYEEAKGDVLHFTADDLEALPGWHIPALLHLSVHDELPAPRVYNYRPDGEFSNAEDGPDGARTHFTRIPIMTRDQYERIGPWPLLNYYADLWVSEKARTLGIETRMIYGYDFVHHWSQIGRVDSKRVLDEAGRALKQIREEMGLDAGFLQ